MQIRTLIRRAPTIVRNAVMDLRYGAPLGGTIHTRFPDQGANDVANSDYGQLRILFAEANVGPDDVIVDVGCGKGRAINWFLSRYPRNTIYGIELDPEVCAHTSKRLRRYPNVTVLCGDATKVLPPEATVYYLFNPFDQTILREFIAVLMRTQSTRARTCIVYSNAQYLDLFRDDPRFEVKMIDVPQRHGAALIQAR